MSPSALGGVRGATRTGTARRMHARRVGYAHGYRVSSHRDFLRVGGRRVAVGTGAPQNRMASRVASVIIAAHWRRALAEAAPRAEPIARFTPLNHILKKGFFIIQGFFTFSPCINNKTARVPWCSSAPSSYGVI